MSAFTLGPEHIDYLIQSALTFSGHKMYIDLEFIDGMNTDEWGQQLVNENYASVNHRYPSHVNPEPYDYSFPCRIKQVEPVQALKAIDCYVYQSCEHKGWHTSKAKAFCDRLRLQAISRLPGYDNAQWEIC